MMDSIQYEQADYEDANFPMILHIDHLNSNRRALYTNWHTGIEVLYCIEGSSTLLLDSDRFDFREGDLAVIRSNVLHTLSTSGDECRYYCLIVEPDYLSAHGFDMEQAAFFEIVRDQAAVALYERVTEAFESQRECQKPAAIASVLNLFTQLYEQNRYQGSASKRKSNTPYPLAIMQALSYINTNLRNPISVDELCKHVNISKYYFCRMFRAHTGHAVVYYSNMLKCEYARKLILENGLNVSETAHYMGIENLSYFARLYKKHMGITPSEERKRAKARLAMKQPSKDD